MSKPLRIGRRPWRAGGVSPLFGVMRKSRSTCRRGYLLTEMLVVISVSSALAVVAVGLIGTLMRVERAGRRHFEETNGLARLSKQFRRDVAAAEEASVPAENTSRPSEIHLRLAADHTVTYRAEPGALLRFEEWSQTEAARERFRLPATGEARFGIDDGRSGRIVALTLVAPRLADESPKTNHVVDADKKRRRIVARDGVSRRGWTIEALVARDLRHVPSSVEEKPTTQEPVP
jgi:type II secretory pathway pseudopilin PulG